jgi:hypothetical protein
MQPQLSYYYHAAAELPFSALFLVIRSLSPA